MSKRYTDEFRAEAVRMVLEENNSVPQVAMNLGINVWTLKEWMKKHRESTRSKESKRPETFEEENRRLKREIMVLEQEREILKKAAAYFAKEHL
jgi:transposase